MNNKTVSSYIPKKKGNNLLLPVLGIGTFQVGGGDHRNPNNNDKKDVYSIRKAIKMGFSSIDTAESYADGYAEILVGKAIKVFDRRKLFITTKVARRHLHYKDVIDSAKKSIERLGVDYVDLYLIHAPNKEISIKETMKAMGFLLENGMIKNIGVSNFNSNLLEEAMGYTKYPIVNNQVHYNLLARYYERDGTLDFCRKNNILVTAYRILGYDQYTAEDLKMLKVFAKKYKKTISQIAINWVLTKPNIVGLVKSSNTHHLNDDLGALGWRMGLKDEKYLDMNFREGNTINTP